jgi:hypothetical protein
MVLSRPPLPRSWLGGNLAQPIVCDLVISFQQLYDTHLICYLTRLRF